MRLSFYLIVLIAFANSLAAKEKKIYFGAASYLDGSVYEVGFCARGADMEGDGPGHAFVVLRKISGGGKVVEFLTAGFGPPKSKPVHGHGLINPERYSHPTQKCLIAETNDEKYAMIKQGIEAQDEYKFAGITIKLTRPYVVLFDDCVIFLQSVAQDFGIEVPSRISGLTPIAFVEALMKRN